MMMGSLRFWIAITAGIAGGFGLVLLPGRTGASAGEPLSVRATIEPVTYLVTSTIGGTVMEVAVHAGDHVEQGQLLVRFQAGEWAVEHAQLIAARNALESALKERGDLLNLPSQARSVIQESHPDVVRAENQYVQALADFEDSSNGERQAARIRLDAAAAERIRVRHQISSILSSGTSDLQKLLATLRTRIAEIDKLLSDAEVRAASSGTVDILEIHTGDRILPGHPVASITADGEYSSAIVLRSSGVTRIRPGMLLKGSLVNGRLPFDWRVDSISQRTIPLVLRESRQIAEETVLKARIIFPAAFPGAIQPGTAADFQLP